MCTSTATVTGNDTRGRRAVLPRESPQRLPSDKPTGRTTPTAQRTISPSLDAAPLAHGAAWKRTWKHQMAAAGNRRAWLGRGRPANASIWQRRAVAGSGAADFPRERSLVQAQPCDRWWAIGMIHCRLRYPARLQDLKTDERENGRWRHRRSARHHGVPGLVGERVDLLPGSFVLPGPYPKGGGDQVWRLIFPAPASIGGDHSAGGRASVSDCGTPSSISFARSISALSSAPRSTAMFVSHSQTSRMIPAANEP